MVLWWVILHIFPLDKLPFCRRSYTHKLSSTTHWFRSRENKIGKRSPTVPNSISNIHLYVIECVKKVKKKMNYLIFFTFKFISIWLISDIWADRSRYILANEFLHMSRHITRYHTKNHYTQKSINLIEYLNSWIIKYEQIQEYETENRFHACLLKKKERIRFAKGMNPSLIVIRKIQLSRYKIKKKMWKVCMWSWRAYFLRSIVSWWRKRV